MEIMRKNVYAIILIAVLFFVQGCENNNAFSWASSPDKIATVESNLSDADRALRDKQYDEAIRLYNEVLAAEANNSNALYGKAAAEIKKAGLDLSHIISALTAETEPGEESNPFDLILGGLDIEELAQGSASAAEALKIIADGKGDGTIAADNADVNINLAFIMTVNAAAELMVKYDVNTLDDLDDVNVTDADVDDTVARLKDAKKYAVVALGAGSEMVQIFDDIIEGIEELKIP